MKRLALAALLAIVAPACAGSTPPVRLVDDWPSEVGEYDDITDLWTRKTILRGQYQEVLELAATFKSPEWRAASAAQDAERRGLGGPARDARMAQAKADAAGPYEFELMVTTWDRRENDLDRGKKSIWRVVILDEQGNEIEPLEIVKDKRPAFAIRAEFPALGDFATAYIVRFARTPPLLGPDVKRLRLRMSSVRGAAELVWATQ
jgi:hypothetical protein